MAKTKILVTGGAGYLGSVLVGRLLERGFQVTVLDNLMYKQHSLIHHCLNPDFEFVMGDCRDKVLITGLIKDMDYILPLAAIVGAMASGKDGYLTTSVNFEAVRMLNQIRSREQRIIFPTTNSGYGTKSGEIYCTEETPLEPISLYGETKVNAERELLSSDNVITLRLATLFGFSLRMRLDLLVNDFTYRAFTEKYIVIFERHFKRNFLHVQDAARCFLHCMDHFDVMKNQVYNAGLNGANLSKEELALRIKKYIPDFYIHFAEIGTDPDKRNYIVSNERITKQGFVPEHSLDDGINELIKGYRMILTANTNFSNQ